MKNSIQIISICVKNFRSIRNIKIDVNNMNVLVGLNDIGKSNLLKALNLFFNEQTDYNASYDFKTDFSNLFPSGSHGTKEITISIGFIFPETFKGKKEFIWEKKWRSEGFYGEKIVDKSGKKPGKGTKIESALRRIRFRYVPAVKSRDYFRGLLTELYSTISSSLTSPLQNSINNFSKVLGDYTNTINKEVNNKLKLSSKLAFPENLEHVFSDFIFITKSEKDNLSINLNYRGDGIQARHIPIIHKYIADEDQKSRSGGSTRITTIWGFEEPENGVELSKAFELADEFKEYSESIQIFVTTHSPAFYMIKDNPSVSVFFAERNNVDGATILRTDPEMKQISQDMGLMPVIAPFVAEKEKELRELSTLSLSNHIEQNLIVVEGKTDKFYIEKAIKLYSEPLQKMIDSNQLIVYTIPGAGGCSNLARIMKSYIVGINKGVKIAVLDKDEAAIKAMSEINTFKKDFGKSDNISAIHLAPSDEIKKLYAKNIVIPFCIEHLLGESVWEKMISRNYVSQRPVAELFAAFGAYHNAECSLKEIVNGFNFDSYISNIVNYNPSADSKMKIQKLVKEICTVGSYGDLLERLKPTIKLLEDKFIKPKK